MVNDIKPANASVPYRYQEYPKMIYGGDGSSKVVKSSEEEEALKASGYLNSPKSEFDNVYQKVAEKVTTIRRKKAQE